MSCSRRRRPGTARMKRRSTATSRGKASFSTARRGQPSARSKPSPAPPPPPRLSTVKVVFVAVRGRARLHVEGIRGRPAYAARLQARVAGAHGIRQAHASPTTGNVLVLFDAGKLELRSLIVAVARHAGEVRNGDSRALTRVDRVWHMLSAAAVTAKLRATPDAGLGAGEVARRLATLGDNSLPTPAPKTSLEILAGHVTSLPVLLLGAAAVLSLGMGAAVDAVVIGAVIVANAVVGYITERRV